MKSFFKNIPEKVTERNFYHYIDSVYNRSKKQQIDWRKHPVALEFKELAVKLRPFYNGQFSSDFRAILERELFKEREALKTIDAVLKNGVLLTEPDVLELLEMVNKELNHYYHNFIQNALTPIKLERQKYVNLNN